MAKQISRNRRSRWARSNHRPGKCMAKLRGRGMSQSQA